MLAPRGRVAPTHATRRPGREKDQRAAVPCPSFVRPDMVAGMTAFPRETMTDPADLAQMVATVLALPDTAGVAELPANRVPEDPK